METQPEGHRSVASRVFGDDRNTQAGLRMLAVTFVAYTLYVGIAALQVHLGLSPARFVYPVAAVVVLANLAFFVAIRSGWAKRIKGDPQLGAVQLVTGIAFMLATYALAGPASGATLIIMASHIVYAMFTIPPRSVIRLVIASLLGLAVVMTCCTLIDPVRYPPGLQLINLLYASLTLPVIARLAYQVTSMRDRLRARRRELAVALAQVRDLAIRDDLTQIHNRRHMIELMEMEARQHQRSGAPLCLGLIDIDLFKAINDSFGHAAGDAVLRRFAALATTTLRSSDLTSRWGGEEFMVLFPDTPADQAVEALDRLRDRLSHESFGDVLAGRRVTFSAGVIEIDPSERLEVSIELVDQAMYLAKTNGRDRIEHGRAVAVPAAI